MPSIIVLIKNLVKSPEWVCMIIWDIWLVMIPLAFYVFEYTSMSYIIYALLIILPILSIILYIFQKIHCETNGLNGISISKYIGIVFSSIPTSVLYIIDYAVNNSHDGLVIEILSIIFILIILLLALWLIFKNNRLKLLVLIIILALSVLLLIANPLFPPYIFLVVSFTFICLIVDIFQKIKKIK